jgi:hypothetical protein
MAKDKFAVGDEVRLTRKIEFGNVQLKPNTRGKIKGIAKKFLGKDEYSIRWAGTGFNMTMYGTGQFTLAQTMDGDVFKS